MEPLVGDREGEPVYLLHHMEPGGLRRYGDELAAIKKIARGAVADVGDRGRMERLVRCLDGALAESPSQRIG